MVGNRVTMSMCEEGGRKPYKDERVWQQDGGRLKPRLNACGRRSPPARTRSAPSLPCFPSVITLADSPRSGVCFSSRGDSAPGVPHDHVPSTRKRPCRPSPRRRTSPPQRSGAVLTARPPPTLTRFPTARRPVAALPVAARDSQPPAVHVVPTRLIRNAAKFPTIPSPCGPRPRGRGRRRQRSGGCHHVAPLRDRGEWEGRCHWWHRPSV